MKSMDKVSIIVAAYNQAAYLSRAIESVLEQSYPHWELIIVDDGSDDATPQVAQRYADSRIRYLRQENRGPASARNRGLEVASGDYVIFLDADDELTPTFLTIGLQVLNANPGLAGCYCLNYFVDEGSRPLPVLGGRVVPPSMLHTQLLDGGFFAIHAVIARLSLLREIGGFEESLSGSEDWDLWLRFTQKYTLVGIPQPLVYYRVYPTTSYHTVSSNLARVHQSRLATLAKYFGATTSPTRERAYGLAYRSAALGYIQQGQDATGWDYMLKAAQQWPPLLQRLDTFYELACGDQSKGYRGQAGLLDIQHQAAKLLEHLARLFEAGGAALTPWRRRAYGQAYLALAMLSDQAGQWGSARRYLLRALRIRPLLLHQPGVIRRLLKLCMGKRVISKLRNIVSIWSIERNRE